jgi:2-dehydro-3-deoxygalactonokinase
MTGETFAIVRTHSLLGRQMAGEGEDVGAFADGVTRSTTSRAGLLHDLFGVRSRGLFGTLHDSAAASYLSGLLVGAEIAGARQFFDGLPESVAVVGTGGLAAKYVTALKALGCRTRIVDGAVAARGLFAIGRAIGL